jgi:hypothetical protein
MIHDMLEQLGRDCPRLSAQRCGARWLHPLQADANASGWQTARLEDKILTGTEPREIPVEMRIKLQFVIYLRGRGIFTQPLIEA